VTGWAERVSFDRICTRITHNFRGNEMMTFYDAGMLAAVFFVMGGFVGYVLGCWVAQRS
jgi:hypothetical protein